MSVACNTPGELRKLAGARWVPVCLLGMFVWLDSAGCRFLCSPPVSHR